MAPDRTPDHSMNSRVSWSSEAGDAAGREATQPSQRSGMPLSQWVNAAMGAPQRPATDAGHGRPTRGAPDVADIHSRLDAITRQIDLISRTATPVPPDTGGVARQLNEAIARLDARLSQISVTRSAARETVPPAYAQPRFDQPRYDQPHVAPSIDAVEHAASRVYSASPPLSPDSLDFAIAEISARQNELEGYGGPQPRMAAPHAARPAEKAPGPDFSSLERQLIHITSQIDSLRRPDVEESIAAFRSELAEIRQAMTEALPRKAIESLESEIRSLGQRIDEGRQATLDQSVLAPIEQALVDIRDVVRSLTPAEQLTGYDEALRSLGAKLDTIIRNSEDPGTIRQLEDAISAMRGIAATVASSEALSRLGDDIRTLGAKVDQIVLSSGHGEALSALEQRISTLTSTLERSQPAFNDTAAIETSLRALSDRIDNLQVGHDGPSTLAHLEQRIGHLLERLEATSTGGSHLSRVETGLADILRHLESQRSSLAALADAPQAGYHNAPAVMDVIRRELSDMRFSQTEKDRQTQDALEVLHNTLGHVVDRLSSIEGDLRTARPAPSHPERPAAPAMAAPPAARPELPNPSMPQAEDAPPLQPAAPARSLSDIMIPREPGPASAPRAPINPTLPPDHPLEPGTRRPSSPAERIAAAEAGTAAPQAEPQNPSNFIAAARRAAQAAAAAAPPPEKKSRSSFLAGLTRKAAQASPAEPAVAPAKAAAPKPAPAAPIRAEIRPAVEPVEPPSTLGSKIRSLLVAASVVVIVLGSAKFVMDMFSPSISDQAHHQLMSPDLEDEPEPQSESGTPPAATPPAAVPQPSMTSPMPLNRQSGLQVPPEPRPEPAQSDVTGSIPDVAVRAPAKPSFVAIPPTETLADGVAGPNLRAAALKGDPAAAYEIAVRYAEGRDVAVSLDEAAKWFERSAQGGIVPAMFRMGTFYEKGISVKKDLAAARRYYMQAADRGNAKAMHNLAVLDADGGGNGANYRSASQWFRKAAERGVADSQFNLGILYARGIGVEQNLAESFKWFSLAAAQGDADAGLKRDDVAKRLDPQSLAAARLAIQTFVVEKQPDDAINVAVPAGGWDHAREAKRPAKSTTAQARPAK